MGEEEEEEEEVEVDGRKGGEKEEEENKAMFGQRLNYFGASLRAKESNGNWPVPFLLLLVCCF